MIPLALASRPAPPAARPSNALRARRLTLRVRDNASHAGSDISVTNFQVRPGSRVQLRWQRRRRRWRRLPPMHAATRLAAASCTAPRAAPRPLPPPPSCLQVGPKLLPGAVRHCSPSGADRRAHPAPRPAGRSRPALQSKHVLAWGAGGDARCFRRGAGVPFPAPPAAPPPQPLCGEQPPLFRGDSCPAGWTAAAWWGAAEENTRGTTL